MSDLPAPANHTPAVAAPGRLGQATAVEQSRAIAEVQAAVVVAQQIPRIISTARGEMRQSCEMKGMAERAFFSYRRGGSLVRGASVYLARELARCWGNVQYAVVELRRDDEAGLSEMMAWAWDVQTNTRASTTFIVPHKRDKQGGPVALVDLRDVYENNANMAARRLREQIFAVLPKWFTAEAEEICERTLEKGDGKPLEERIAAAVKVFDGLGVSVDRLELKMGRSSDRWSGFDIAELMVIHRSIQRREVTIEDAFPPPRVTREEVVSGGPAGEIEAPPLDPPPPAPEGQVDQRPPTKTMLGQLSAALRGAGRDVAWVAGQVGRDVDDLAVLTRDEVVRLLADLQPAEEGS